MSTTDEKPEAKPADKADTAQPGPKDRADHAPPSTPEADHGAGGDPLIEGP